MFDMVLYVGCPIWSFKGWVGNFYPKGAKPADYLREYSRRLTTVEGNTTFYAVPSPKNLESWAAEMPENFRFCPKVPRAISHEGRLADHLQEALRFIEIMNQLGTRLGPMFLQLPPRFSPRQFDDLNSFLEAWPEEQKLAVEVRHLEWFDAPHEERLNSLLTEHGMARVVIDTRPIRSLDGDRILEGSVYQTLLEARQRKPNLPVIPQRTADFVFLRYIGHPQLELNRPLLEEWGDYLGSQVRAGQEAFAFCHSPDNLAAPWLCRLLYRHVAGQANLPPLPWEQAEDSSPDQPNLL